MQTYVVIALKDSAAAIDAAVQTAIADEDKQQIEPGKWLLSSATLLTSKTVADKLNLQDSESFIVFPVRGYYGRARTDIWEWLSAKS